MLELRKELLKYCYHYYPIGHYQIAHVWDGLQELKKIVENKINDECNDTQSVSNRLCAALKNKLEDTSLENRNYYSCPSYTIVINLGNEISDDIRHISFLQADISLLCNHFTIFYVDEYRFENTGSKDLAPIFSIYSLNAKINKVGDDLFKLVASEINSFIPDKKYAHHKILFDNKIIGSVPFGEEWSPNPADNVYSLYDLLFFYTGKTDIPFKVLD